MIVLRIICGIVNIVCEEKRREIGAGRVHAESLRLTGKSFLQIFKLGGLDVEKGRKHSACLL